MSSKEPIDFKTMDYMQTIRDAQRWIGIAIERIKAAKTREDMRDAQRYYQRAYLLLMDVNVAIEYQIGKFPFAFEVGRDNRTLAQVLADAERKIDAKALDRLAEDIGLPENDADLEEAAAIAREQDQQVRRTINATYDRVRNQSPLGGHVDDRQA